MFINMLGHIITRIVDIDPSDWENYPREEDGGIISCENSWSTAETNDDSFMSADFESADQIRVPTYPVYTSSESFTFPINASLHYLLARGSLFSGVVVVRGKEGADPNIIDVNVNVRYATHLALSRARVCKLERPEGGVGIGIFTPSNLGRWSNYEQDQLRFLVTVTLPTSRNSLLDLNAFDTNLPNFRHKFEGLGDRVQFEHMSLQGTNGVIQADSLYVSQGTIKTTNAGINGEFNTTDSLVLQTTNGVIDVDVGITNDDTHKASSLDLKSTNGRIASRVSLLTTHDQRPQPKGGHFTVRATTSNGRLEVGFPTSPVNSLLDFEGHTTNSAADLSLHAAYEGKFSLRTTSASAEIDNHGHPDDPSGQKRYRTITTTKNTKTAIDGKVFWGREEDHHGDETGRAVVQTTNGWTRLRLL